MSMLYTTEFWLALSQIILINIVLSGDNAVVIALASRSLPPAQQKKAILFGSFGAIGLRIVLTFFAVYLLSLPFLKLAGAGLLLWIGIGLLRNDEGDEEIENHSNLAAAIKTIIIADLVMSLDNVIGVAAAAKGNTVLLVVGLAISIPLIIYGSTLILKLMARFPVIITIGAALLGWVAGEMAFSDPAIKIWADSHQNMHLIPPVLGAMLVVAVGKWLASRSTPQPAGLA
ncbi:TerC family protein [Lacisediminimonas sp.]|uniref:TerC family protein n=1 Tax=Lacisediminimonas sp. TaxID=3060582 RepID=UPI002716A12D|nr:TerC family protein [Lacisediminimonas sp.]MDO8298821.1 TerC family protein [Lacisediminimonas sp.]MDO9217652.1 TerC family protein [Lacisediminimonas sp.]